MERCSWCNVKNPKYVEYHDREWGVKSVDDAYLFEMLILESFQAGLSWECILNKRDNFRKCYDNFDIDKVMNYDEEKIGKLGHDSGIVRNRLKIRASVGNARVFKGIQREFGSFYNYLQAFAGDRVYFEVGKTTNWLSDAISEDLIRRGMKFVGSTIVYSYLQAVGIIYSHERDCYLYNDVK